MQRITPEMVKEAYLKTGFIPRRGSLYGHTAAGARCGCAVGVLAFDKTGREVVGFALEECIGVPQDYLRGLAFGFDGTEGPLEQDEIRLCGWGELCAQGYSDGLACAAAVFGESQSA